MTLSSRNGLNLIKRRVAMKTVKEVSEITGISIRTLRYYDEIGLLKPTQLTEAGYRLYDNKALEKLQEIMFFRELEIPLSYIKEIIVNPNYDKEQALINQKSLLEHKQNRLAGIIELIDNVIKGVNTMSFEAFNNDDIQKILDHMLKNISKEALAEQVKKYGSIEKYREHMSTGFDEKRMAQLVKWYGSKEKAIDASLQATENLEEQQQLRNKYADVDKQFAIAKKTDNADLANEAVARLAEYYKETLKLDNARNILLDTAKEFLESEKIAEVMDSQYGEGYTVYKAKAIQSYYGV